VGEKLEKMEASGREMLDGALKKVCVSIFKWRQIFFSVVKYYHLSLL